MRVISFGEKETIHRPREDNTHDYTDNDDDKKLYIHTIKTGSPDEKFLHRPYLNQQVTHLIYQKSYKPGEAGGVQHAEQRPLPGV